MRYSARSVCAAALVAGIIGAVVVDLHLSAAQQLVAVCPCMVLVPGPHLLNGALDLARTEISLGVARISYASVMVLMMAMAFGLIIPKLCIDRFRHSHARATTR
jgi:uncharacterized membrane protein YjjP (DUF1212 family)